MTLTKKELTISQLDRFLEEKEITSGVKLENYLLVVLGLRPGSLTLFPAELKDGAVIGVIVDEIFRERHHRRAARSSSGLSGFFSRLKEIFGLGFTVEDSLKYKSDLIRKALTEVLAESSSYKAHKVWAADLGLKSYEVEVRPSVREFYLYREDTVFKTIRKIVDRRRMIWDEVRRGVRRIEPGMIGMFPEETDREFIETVGSLLGHPSCCIERYVEDRLSGKMSPEFRASRQIKQSRSEGINVDPYAYYVKDFLPCEPTCRQAASLGRQAHQVLGKLDPRLAELYYQRLLQNMALIERYPELLEDHYHKLKARSVVFHERH